MLRNFFLLTNLCRLDSSRDHSQFPQLMNLPRKALTVCMFLDTDFTDAAGVNLSQLNCVPPQMKHFLTV